MLRRHSRGPRHQAIVLRSERPDPLESRRRGRARAALGCEPLEARQLLAGTITGLAFQDFNSNGTFDTTLSAPNTSGNGSVGFAIDRGVGGVTVTAFDSGNVARGTTTTAADGTYTLNATGVGPYRIEFTTLPAGFFPGPAGTTSRTTVQFVPDGNSANVSVGLVIPSDYSQDNPDLVTSVHYFGDLLTGPNANDPAIISFPYNAGSNSTSSAASYTDPTTHALAVPANQVGTVWGLAYNRSSRNIYAVGVHEEARRLRPQRHRRHLSGQPRHGDDDAVRRPQRHLRGQHRRAERPRTRPTTPPTTSTRPGTRWARRRWAGPTSRRTAARST